MKHAYAVSSVHDETEICGVTTYGMGQVSLLRNRLHGVVGIRRVQTLCALTPSMVQYLRWETETFLFSFGCLGQYYFNLLRSLHT